MNTQRWLAVALASFVIVGCATAPEEDPVYIRMNDLDARVQRIERVLTNQSLLELAQRIDALQANLRTLRGEVELLQNETQGGKNQSRTLYGDLEKRLAALETLGGVGGAPAGGAGRSAGSPDRCRRSSPRSVPSDRSRRRCRAGDRRSPRSPSPGRTG